MPRPHERTLGPARLCFRRVAAVASLALLAAAALGLRSAAADPDLVEVPDVAGQDIEAAGKALVERGLVVATVEVDGAPAGSVAAQSPEPAALLPRGAVVVLDVRQRHDQRTPAPKASGLRVAEAVTAFGALYDLAFQPVPGAPGDRGRVVGQSPAPGASLPLRGRLTLSFVPDPTAARTTSVPSAAHLPPAEAIESMAAAGLHARIAHVVQPGTPPDLVVGQVPVAGTEVARYATVVLVVSAEAEAGEGSVGGAVVAVPNLVGLTESAARVALNESNLDLDVAWVDGPPTQAFLVRAQQPLAGASAETGSTVRVEIVRYEAPGTTPPGLPATKVACPELVGLTQGQAEALLASLGLLGYPILETTASAPPLRVFAQQVIPGTLLDLGAQVAYRVAKPPPPPTATPVPNFFGRSQGEALVAAAHAGLALTILDVVTPSHPPHRVYSQNVPAYAVVPLGTAVTVKIARPPAGPPMAPVPNLHGLFKAQALGKLAAAGFAGNAIDVTTLAHPALRVFDQSPDAGHLRPVGSVVAFKVAKTPLALKTVPPLVGLTKAAAIAAVNAAGLNPVPSEHLVFGKPIGKVYEQDPVAGTQRLPGSPVAFRVAKPLLVLVPDVVTKSTAVASNLIEAAGLTVSVKPVPAPGQPAGKVFAQSPLGGVSVAPGTVVEIRIPMGLGVAVTVPPVVGLSQAAAISALSAKGLLHQVTDVVSPAAQWGKVIAQNPVGGTPVVAGALVKISVGKPLGMAVVVAVPNVVTLSKAAAVAALQAKGFVVDVDEIFAPGHPIGKVFDQNPNAGTLRPSGSTVQIRVAKASIGATTVVPPLIGKTPAQAAFALAAAGLGSNGIQFIVFGKPPGKVWWQSQAAGTVVPKGTVVTWRWTP